MSPEDPIPDWRAAIEKTPHTRAGVEALARALGACPDVPALLDEARSWAPTAPDAAARLLLAAHAAGHPPSAAQVLPHLPFVDALTTFSALIAATAPAERVDLVLAALAEGHLYADCVCVGLLLAALACPPGQAPEPLRLVLRERSVGWSRPSHEVGFYLAAALHLEDEPATAALRRAGASEVASRAVFATAREVFERPPLMALPEREPPRVLARHTARREAPKVGRNDPCWCGSGQKYKKCHAGRDDDRGLVEVSPQRPAGAAPADPDIEGLRQGELLGLDLAALSPIGLIRAQRRLAALHRWDEAAACARRLVAADAAQWSDHVGELIDDLFMSGELERADALIAELALDARISGASHLIRGAREPHRVEGLAWLAARVAEALAGTWEPLLDLAYGLEYLHPALTVVLARAAFDAERAFDMEVLDECVGKARARMGLAPAADPFSQRFDREVCGVGDQAAGTGPASGPAPRQQALEADAARAREQAEALSAELAQQASRERELRQALAAEREARQRGERLERRRIEREEATGAVPVPAAPGGRERELQDKLERVQGLMRERNDEKRRLARRLTELERRVEDLSAAPPAGAVALGAGAEAEAEEAPLSPPDRVVRVPEFTPAARAALRADPAVAGAAVLLAGRLATGEASAWREVKKLKMLRAVFSGRVGLRHRLLFALGDDTLEVLDLVDRGELEVRLNQLKARGL